jgi:hypothetical protein
LTISATLIILVIPLVDVSPQAKVSPTGTGDLFADEPCWVHQRRAATVAA